MTDKQKLILQKMGEAIFKRNFLIKKAQRAKEAVAYLAEKDIL